MISIYSKYSFNGKYSPVQTNRSSHTDSRKPPSAFGGGLSELIGSILGGLDTGDILLLLILLLLYLDSHDEEFLIILAVLLFSMRN